MWRQKKASLRLPAGLCPETMRDFALGSHPDLPPGNVTEQKTRVKKQRR